MIDQDTDRMAKRLGFAVKGQMVRFLAKNGYTSELDNAKTLFTLGKRLIVDSIEIGGFRSYYTFEGHKGSFNTVMFERVSDDIENTAFGTADMCEQCGMVAGPLGLRRHPRYSLKVGITINGEPDMGLFYAHDIANVRALVAMFPPADIVGVDWWNDGTNKWEEVLL